jgi:hypothetical protein
MELRDVDGNTSGWDGKRQLVKVLLWVLPVILVPAVWMSVIIMTWPDNGPAL